MFLMREGGWLREIEKEREKDVIHRTKYGCRCWTERNIRHIAYFVYGFSLLKWYTPLISLPCSSLAAATELVQQRNKVVKSPCDPISLTGQVY